MLKHQLHSSCVIMFVILMTTLIYKAVILQGEIWRWSFVGLKGLITVLHYMQDKSFFISDLQNKSF